MKIILKLIMASALVLALTVNVFAQTNLHFTAVAVTDEHAIRLTWSSESNKVYEIDEADALIDTNTGSITWNKLYDDYPSQGTNTFWLDTGNYNFAPQILHPQNMPMRFYRIVDKGVDTTSDEPSVSITSPINSIAVSDELTVTVIASTDQPVLSGTKLYVDGQEMRSAVSTTNYTDGSGVTNYEVDTYSINTCEWGNETHVLFATAECESGNGDEVNSPPIASGHAVSPFVSVLFSNLVTRISFSQPSFDPSSGQTQHVSAVFAANCDWTLTVRDVFSNAVHIATGSGSSLQHDWNGTGDGGTNLPTGIYYYYISAQTNGQAYMSMMSGGSGSFSSSAAALSAASEEVTELWALSPESSAPLPLAIYPPGFNANGFTIFEASQSEVKALTKAVLSADKPVTMVKSTMLATSDNSSGSSPQPNAAGGGSSSSSQNSSATPQRPPNNPIIGIAGLCGIVYDTYQANGTNGINVGPLDDGFGLGLHISMQGFPAGNTLNYAPLPQYKAEANNFIDEMQLWGWQNKILKVDDKLNIDDLRGSGTPFNQVDLGVMMFHGTYGYDPDYAANGTLQMYYPITSGGSAQYLRLSEMNLGGGGTNGLKWFAILACNSLQDFNWDDIQNNGTPPYNGNLHLLLGTDSVSSTSSVILQYWAKYMNVGKGSSFSGVTPMTIREAWYQAAKDAYHGHNYANTVKFAVAGDSACMDDFVQAGYNSSPGGTWTYDSSQVWP